MTTVRQANQDVQDAENNAASLLIELLEKLGSGVLRDALVKVGEQIEDAGDLVALIEDAAADVNRSHRVLCETIGLV